MIGYNRLIKEGVVVIQSHRQTLYKIYYFADNVLRSYYYLTYKTNRRCTKITVVKHKDLTKVIMLIHMENGRFKNKNHKNT